MVKYIYGCTTDVGSRKKVNQDAIGVRNYVSKDGNVFFAVICDGIGGLECGELASADTVAQCMDWFIYEFPQMAGEGIGEKELRERVEYMISNQDERLRNYGAKRNIQLGTTVSILLCMYPCYYIWHVGDCRIYRIGKKMFRLTEDQSLVQKELNLGRITEEQARHDKRRNIILQSLGAGDAVMPAFYTGNFEKGDLFLLCTDGMIHQIEENELQESFCFQKKESRNRMEECQRQLIRKAKERGERDNLSIITVRAEEDIWIG